MLKWVGAGVVISLVGLVTYVFVYTKAFLSPELTGVQLESVYLLYTEHLGAYHRIDPKLREAEKLAIELGLSCRQTFGYFLDNPQYEEEDRLRAEVGCWLSGKLPEVVTVPEPFRFEERPGGAFLKVIWQGSPAIGPIKVYPAARKWFAEQRLQIPSTNYEVYEMTSDGKMQTTYYFQVVNSNI